jgi:hypothetical protein
LGKAPGRNPQGSTPQTNENLAIFIHHLYARVICALRVRVLEAIVKKIMMQIQYLRAGTGIHYLEFASAKQWWGTISMVPHNHMKKSFSLIN